LKAFSRSAPATNQPTTNPLGELVGIVIGVIVMGAMLSKMLPTTFGRGILIAICQMLMALAVGLVLMCIVFAVMAAAG
jgi:hypothetical protein